MFDGEKLISRLGKEFKGLDHILHEAKTTGLRLDGELYSDELSFQEIVSLCRKTKNLTEESKKIKLIAYDVVDESKPYHERYKSIVESVSSLKNIEVVSSSSAASESEIFTLYDQFINAGYEGAMVRAPNSLYKINGRSSDLLKVKQFIDEEFEIVGYKYGVGKFANVPTFELVCEHGTFEAVPKGTEASRKKMLDDAPRLIGKMATIRYFELTDDQIPRFPIMVEIRDYE